MGILIKGMKMPNKCEECPLSFHQQDSDQGGCVATNYYIYREWGKRKPYWCPLVEVVRCKDCKWIDLCKDPEHYEYKGANGFCSKGEQKGANND